MKGIMIALFLALVLSGCARPTATYREFLETSNIPSQTDARFILFRPKDSLDAKILGGARSVRVKIDNEKAGYLKGGFKTFDVPAGKHIISVDLWNQPGSCQLEIEAAAGEFYSQIGPRRGLAEEIAGDLAGKIAVNSVGAGPAIGSAAVIGSANSRVRTCTGGFSIKTIEKEVAASRFADLKRN